MYYQFFCWRFSSGLTRLLATIALASTAAMAGVAEVPPAMLDQAWSGPSSCYGGVPTCGGTEVLESSGYVVGYQPSRRMSAWVAYRLGADQVTTTAAKRPSRFSADVRVDNPVRHDDYTHSGFDRGHMAPNRAIGLQHGVNAQRETFLLTNICPQTPNLNRGIWKSIEAREQNKWRVDYCEIWTMVGPVFSKSDPQIDSGIQIPQSYWRLTVDEAPESSTIRCVATLFSEQPDGTWAYRLATVDEVEVLTGIDFFTEIPDVVEEVLESTPSDSSWWSGDLRTGCDSTPTRQQEKPKANPDSGDGNSDSSPAKGGLTHWISSSSGVRHNDGCRWFKKSRGKLGESTDGRPCKNCGG
jgi:DNA/RNA endonuclease G (NUC1)